jgi:hypothetical protein
LEEVQVSEPNARPWKAPLKLNTLNFGVPGSNNENSTKQFNKIDHDETTNRKAQSSTLISHARFHFLSIERTTAAFLVLVTSH